MLLLVISVFCLIFITESTLLIGAGLLLLIFACKLAHAALTNTQARQIGQSPGFFSKSSFGGNQTGKVIGGYQITDDARLNL